MLRELVTILNQPLQAGWHYVKTARQFVFPLGMDYLQTLDELFTSLLVSQTIAQ